MDKADVKRFLGNLCRVPMWHTVFNAKEVEYLFKISGGDIICQGRLRKIIVDKITNNCFKVYTKKMIFS